MYLYSACFEQDYLKTDLQPSQPAPLNMCSHVSTPSFTVYELKHKNATVRALRFSTMKLTSAVKRQTLAT